MLNVFTLENGRLSGRLFQEEKHRLEIPGRTAPVWIDMEAPTPEEKAWVREKFGLAIPEDIVDDDLEESARFYEEDNGELHIRSDFLIDDDVTPRNVRVAFILHRSVLFSVHAEDLPVFRLLRLRAHTADGCDKAGQDEMRGFHDETPLVKKWASSATQVNVLTSRNGDRKTDKMFLKGLAGAGPLTPVWNEPGRTLRIALELVSELGMHFCFFSDRQAPVHDQQNRKHQQREQRWPLQQEARHDDVGDRRHEDRAQLAPGDQRRASREVGRAGILLEMPGARQHHRQARGLQALQ